MLSESYNAELKLLNLINRHLILYHIIPLDNSNKEIYAFAVTNFAEEKGDFLTQIIKIVKIL